MLKNNYNLLPEAIQDIVSIIGFTATQKLVDNFGGNAFHIGKGKIDGANKKLLIDAIGEESANQLMSVYGGDKIYIPRCNLAIIAHRNQCFINEFEKLVADGNSKNKTMLTLCPKYNISDRYAWEIIKKNKQTNQPNLL